MTIQAVYQGGILRPVQPLALEEGEIVDITITKSNPAAQPASKEEITHRLQSAGTITDWVEATKLLPPDDGGYDILRALNENRLWSGERGLISDAGTTP